AIPRERGHDDAGNLVAGLVLRIVERLLLRVDDPVRRCRLVTLQGELRPHLVVADVVEVSASRLRVTLAARLRPLCLFLASAVAMLTGELPYRAGPDALPVPDVGLLTRVGKIFVAVRLAFADMACGHASPRLEGGRVDVPDHRELVFVVLVVVAALVVRILQLFPRAVGLLHPWAPLKALRGVLVLDEEIHGVTRIDRAQSHLRGAAREIPATDHLDDEGSRRLPRVADLRLHRRRSSHLPGDEDVLLRNERPGDDRQENPHTDHGHHVLHPRLLRLEPALYV